MAHQEALIRLAYTSRSNATPAQLDAQAQAIATAAGAFNARHGITGVLALVSGRYLQILEGPAKQVEALFEHIRRDPRHSDVTLLLCAPIETTMFPDWSMGLIERTEAADVTAARAAAIQQRLAEDRAISASDLLRWMFAPSANAPNERTTKRQDSITRIAFASPGGVWNAAVLQHLATDKRVRVGRSQVADAREPKSRALLEYADVDVDHVGTVRALSMSRDPGSCPLMAPMLEDLSLLVFLLGPSEFEQFTPYFCSWIQQPQVMAAQPRLLLLTNLSAERSQSVMEMIRSHTTLPASTMRVKLSEPDSVWAATRQALPEADTPHLATANKQASADAPVASEPPKPVKPRSTSAAVPKKRKLPAAAAAVAVAVSAPVVDPLHLALSDSECLEELLQIEGAVEAAALLVPTASVLLFKSRDGSATDAQMQGHAQFLQAKHRLVQRLSADDSPEEVVIVTRDRLHLFRALPSRPTVCLALSLDRTQTQLGVARLRLQEIEQALALL